MGKRACLLLILMSLSTSVFARDWKRHEVPGAKCGDGNPYSIFIDQQKDSSKVLLELMGGGACWDTYTCYGPKIRTWIHPIPELRAYSTLTSEDPELSPVPGSSAVYFPYCTGDVFAGRHKANYQWDFEVRHTGYTNILKAIQYLREENILEHESVKEFMVYGNSAGAIGAFIHAQNFDRLFPSAEKKVIISDSPGLHFGKNFWEKFPQNLFRDIERALGTFNFPVDRSTGFLAPDIPKACDFYSDFEIGFLQGSQDLVMSKLFGEISTGDHQDLVYSSGGLYQVTKNVDNCSAWTPKSKMHTFTILPQSANDPAFSETGTRRTATEFVFDVWNGGASENFR